MPPVVQQQKTPKEAFLQLIEKKEQKDLPSIKPVQPPPPPVTPFIKYDYKEITKILAENRKKREEILSSEYLNYRTVTMYECFKKNKKIKI